MNLESAHVITVSSTQRPGSSAQWWRAACSCGKYRSSLYSVPEKAGSTGQDHVRDKTTDEDPGPLTNIERHTAIGNRSNVKWTATADGITHIRYADDHGRLNVEGMPIVGEVY